MSFLELELEWHTLKFKIIILSNLILQGKMPIEEQTFSQKEDGEGGRHRLLHESPNCAENRLRASSGELT
jgi:hypothetical protein